MPKITFNLDPNFFDELLARCEKERSRINNEMPDDRAYVGGFIGQGFVMPHEIYPVTSVPPGDQMKLLVETIFWASLEREEGRSLIFSIAYDVPPTENGYAVELQAPLPLNVRTITKLALAIRSFPRALAVAPSENKKLEIRGLLTHSSAPLKIKCLDPGKLIVSYADKNMALISGAEAAFIRGADSHWDQALWKLLKRVSLGDDHPAYSEVKLDIVIAALREMRRLGHGGALIIVPFGDKWKTSTEQPISYSGKSPSKFLSALTREMSSCIGKHGRYSEQSYLLRNRLEEAARNLAQLTAIDGAAIVDCDLGLLGFGVKLKPEPDNSEPPMIYNIDPLEQAGWGTQTKLSGIGGTRHQSAARFIFNQREAVALVVSQDRNITGFVWRENFPDQNGQALCLYRNLELTLP